MKASRLKVVIPESVDVISHGFESEALERKGGLGHQPVEARWCARHAVRMTTIIIACIVCALARVHEQQPLVACITGRLSRPQRPSSCLQQGDEFEDAHTCWRCSWIRVQKEPSVLTQVVEH